MNRLFLAILFFTWNFLSAQNMDGAWQLIYLDEKPVEDTITIKIYQDGYFAYASWDANTNEFLSAAGGEFFIDSGYSEKYDFHTSDSTLVGREITFEGFHRYDGLVLAEIGGGVEKAWKRISVNKNNLSGTWVFTGRERDGKMQRSTPGARRTIKILSGDRFQWIAFNSETGEFFGTGGGTYSAENGKYTENIEFFSRDNSRAGAKIPFDYTLNDNEWHHKGKSSKGDPMYEIWSPYRVAYEDENENEEEDEDE
ncbi:hypothetical protein [Salinimicrobium gaetbulicola]|uniref:Membrane or secreted protein n=1 Tax=Salinimicrobium gaetbulicola TaxID=999702 RepID=A0ABW3IIS1_9FLAO